MHNLYQLKDALETIESFLNLHPTGSMQRTDRDGEEVHLFHPIHRPQDRRVIEGFIWQLNAADIQYEINMEDEGLPTVEVIAGSGNLELDIAKIVAEIPKLFTTSLVRKAAYLSDKEGGGGPGKKGYYLIVGAAKATALANFKDALSMGIGSANFVGFCIPRNLKMVYYKLPTVQE